MKRILIAVTGASGSIYAQRLLECLLEAQVPRVYLVATPTAQKVASLELGSKSLLPHLLDQKVPQEYRSTLRVFGSGDFFAPSASGSSVPTHMVVVPCSMGSLARIATGISGNLIERSADVMLKQKKPLILVPRETPFNTIHLGHMLALSQMGSMILPAMPGFYQKPKTVMDLVNFVVGRILEALDIEHKLYRPWNQTMC
jgi:4-hydroxy-3-polyprenylbenzoate decarboxylase